MRFYTILPAGFIAGKTSKQTSGCRHKARRYAVAAPLWLIVLLVLFFVWLQPVPGGDFRSGYQAPLPNTLTVFPSAETNAEILPTGSYTLPEQLPSTTNHGNARQSPSSRNGAVPPAAAPSGMVSQSAPSSVYFSMFDPGTRYYYQQLTAKEQAVFTAIYDGMMRFEEEIEFSPTCTGEELTRVMFVLYNDCPELLQLSLQYGKRYRDPDAFFSITMQYTMEETQFQAVIQQTISAVDEMQNAADFGQTDVSRELSIYRNILARCAYNADQPFSDRACGPLVYGYGKCDGYANALTFALRYYGIPSTLICGTGYQLDSPDGAQDHCWNYVMIDRQWYQCDSTWDDAGSGTIPVQADFLPFFNLTDERMLWEHSIDPPFTDWHLPVCDSTDAYYYANHGVFVKQDDDFANVLSLALTQAYQNQSDSIGIAFAAQDDYRSAYAALQSAVQAWRYGNVQIRGISYTYSNEGLVLYLYDIAFT